METSDLIPGQNSGASYFGEAAYISPHEYTWCQSHPDQCNMFNNYSYRRFSVRAGLRFLTFRPWFYRPNATCYPSLGSYERDSQSA